MTKSFLAFMETITEQRAAGCSPGACWQPAADIYRTNDGWLVKFDLAGVDPSEVQLNRTGNCLTLVGTRRDGIVQRDLCSYSLEISYNRFERTIELPNNIETAEAWTEYCDGMLLVWLTRQC
jgi:HSP20 family protein